MKIIARYRAIVARRSINETLDQQKLYSKQIKRIRKSQFGILPDFRPFDISQTIYGNTLTVFYFIPFFLHGTITYILLVIKQGSINSTYFFMVSEANIVTNITRPISCQICNCLYFYDLVFPKCVLAFNFYPLLIKNLIFLT